MFFIIISLFVIQIYAEDYVHSPLQYHSQSDRGTYNYGYDTGLFGAHQFHQEYKDLSGKVRGRYGYTDPNGQLRLVHYTSGPEGYNVISDTSPNGINSDSGKREKPIHIVTEVTKPKNIVDKVINQYRGAYSAPLNPPKSPKFTYTAAVLSKPTVTPVSRISYIAGRDYGVESNYNPNHNYNNDRYNPIGSYSNPKPLLSPVQRYRKSAINSQSDRSVNGENGTTIIVPEHQKPEINPPIGYKKCLCF